ncbi:MAG: 50S ribosomal protein L35 [Ignavibacteriae bacterium]|nr:50S ribosomal protein L35 [Ignavibacteriota bacterium]
MPKMKSDSGVKKRFRRTASGKFKRRKAFRSHLLSSKSTKRKRQLRKPTLVSKQEQKKIAIMLHP